MLQFTDLNHVKHTIHLKNLNNVTARIQNGLTHITFHMIGPHAVPLILDSVTSERIQKQLENS